MCRINAASHRILRDDLNTAFEILCLLLRRRKHGQIARVDTPRQLARGEHIELIEVAARNPDLELRAYVVLPDLHRLIGQTVDEVCDDDRPLLFDHAAQRCDHCFAVVNAPDCLTNARIKGLDAEGETVDARIHRRLDLTL